MTSDFAHLWVLNVGCVFCEGVHVQVFVVCVVLHEALRLNN